MTLLSPGTMLLAASLTVPPLVVFYLLKLRRRPLRVTSTMLWEQAAHDMQVNVPLRWIRPNWLLLLHALILALLL
ncbi:MAG: BatA domain-containing protein, partial [Phycisphaerales bacterium]|nr:BatA domain-containing protein [Phycisphaerales bacterium]